MIPSATPARRLPASFPPAAPSRALRLLTLLAIALLVVAPPAMAQAPATIYSFGDSLSDMGRVYAASNQETPPSPPYYQGRFSNGPVWVEVMHERFGLTPSLQRNWAYGGAETDSHPAPGLPGMVQQVQFYLAGTSGVADPTALYTLWAGGNDYLNGDTDPAAVVDAIETAVNTLISAGATRFLVCNLPDLGRIPAGVASGNAAGLTTLTVAHNADLLTTMTALETNNPGTDIDYLDVFSIFNDVLNNPADFGISNTTTPCFDGASVCPDPDASLFWDGIHPTAAGHRVLGRMAADEVIGTFDYSAMIVR